MLIMLDGIIGNVEAISYNSDGQCEQSGYQVRTAATQEVSFHLPYSELPDVWLQVQHTAASTDGRPPLLNGITTTNFVANIYTAYAGFY